MKKLIISLMLALSVFSAFAQAETESISPSYVAQNADPKYIFMFIGDGMSAPQINAAQIFNGTNVPGQIAIKPLVFTQFPVVGIQYTQDATSFCPDSASTATSLSSRFLMLDGYTLAGSESLMYAGFQGIDMLSLFSGAVLLSSGGAVMDLAVDVAASMSEVYDHCPGIALRELFMSGIRVRRAGYACDEYTGEQDYSI